MSFAARLIPVYALALFAIGVVLNFAPAELAPAIGGAAAGPAVLYQVVGAAFFGFAATNWMVRHAPVGGIYGRAVVLGNLGFAVVGALALAKGLPDGAGWGYWTLLGVLAVGAALHGALLLGDRFSKAPREGAAC